MSASSRALRPAAVFAGIPAVLVGVALAIALGWIAGVVALVVVAAGLMVWARFAGDRMVASRLGGRPADPRADARLYNLVEGLSSGAGVRQPRLVVVDSPGLNALAAGTSRRKAVVAVTSALLAELDRIELEAVLALELWLIRRDEIVPATVLAGTFGLGRDLALEKDRDSRADQGAISITRYPPALAAALEKIDSKGSVVAGQPGWMSQLWLTDPRPGGVRDRGRLALAERVEALREL